MGRAPSAASAALIGLVASLAPSCTMRYWAPEPHERGFFPEGELFEPLIADPLEPRMGVVAGRFDHGAGEDFFAGLVNIGAPLGVYRWSGEDPKDGAQLGIASLITALFDMETSSQPLVDVDFLFGIPVTWRDGPHSVRLQIMHQSSHIGDEFKERTGRAKRGLSHDNLELVYSRDLGDFRAYGGGGFLVAGTKGSEERGSLQAGLEYRGSGGDFAPIAAIDLQSIEEHDFTVDVSIKAGVELGPRRRFGRKLRVMVELFKGHSPFGQFFRERLTSLGISMTFDL